MRQAHRDFYICRMATEEVLVAVLSFYGSHYRQASNLQVGLDCSNISSSRMRHSLTDAFQRARLDRGAFRTFPPRLQMRPACLVRRHVTCD